MSWSKHRERKNRRSYHHGDLREALVRAALELIAAKGPSGFTFAEVARATGVSAAAPYRHFRDRDELMSEVARRGFEHFEARLLAAWNDGRPDTFSAFRKLGQAYLEFARNEPAFYASMFESGLPLDLDPELARVGERAFAILHRATEELCSKYTLKDRPPIMMVSRHIWAMTHGIADLFARGDAARRKLPMPPEDLLEAGTLIYLRGLGFGTDLSEDEQKIS